jgi:hypothetical protein
MKKIIAFVLPVLFSGHFAFAQDKNEQDILNNEIKLNVGATAFLYPEINYERILSDDSGLGIGVLFSLINDEDVKYLITPFYRFYFGRHRAQAFFVEVNAGLKGSKEEEYSMNGGYFYKKSHVNFGLGAAMGGKFIIPRKRIICEFYLGGGRMGSSDLYPRVGISVGKRF